MIVKNEEDTLPHCLDSVKGIFDKIVIIDTGSKDRTIEIAKRYTDNIYSYDWHDDFASARNFSFEMNDCDYIMWLDADDVLTPKDADLLLKLRNSLDGKTIEYVANYQVGFDENGVVTLEYYRERIFLRSAGLLWSGRIHETIPILPSAKYATFSVTHRKIHPTEPGRNLRIYEKMLAEGEVLDSRNQFYYSRELYYNGHFQKAIIELEAFLLTKDSFLENRINACLILSRCRSRLGLEALPSLFKSFEYDLPRAEICCEIGEIFSNKNRLDQAIYWYSMASTIKPNLSNFSFVYPECHDFIPYIQLCVLYYKKGDTAKAIEYNNKAAKIKPDNQAVLFNQNFFKTQRKEEE